jgi:hypothetical protein
MTALTRTPDNTNFLQPSKFILTFGRIPTVQYFCQEANLPGVALGSTKFDTPLLDIPIAGNKLTYNQLQVNFIVDESIQSWTELYNWLRAFGSPKSLSDRSNQSILQTGGNAPLNNYSEATLTVMSALNNPLFRVNYHKLFPTSLSDIQFDVKNSADTIITATASFAYEYFEITRA